MPRDKIFLIEPGFTDPIRPGLRFVCPFCNQVEGLLSAFPELAERVEVERVPFLRPRRPVIAILGEEHQSLPVLVYGDNPPPDAAEANGRRFTDDTKSILEQLALRHGFPHLH
jgi:hypothetical protein